MASERGGAQIALGGAAALGPRADVRQQNDAEQRHKRKPRDARLAARQHKRREQRAQRGAGVAADLKQRLRHAVLSTGSHARHARRFGMKHGGAHAHQRRRDEHGCVAGGERQGQQAH